MQHCSPQNNNIFKFRQSTLALTGQGLLFTIPFGKHHVTSFRITAPKNRGKSESPELIDSKELCPSLVLQPQRKAPKADLKQRVLFNFL